MAEKICDFEFHHINNTYNRDGDTLRVHVNWKTDTDIEKYGAVMGTLTVEHDMTNPNATSGSCQWQGEAFLPDGSRAMGWAEGTWETTGDHVWTLKMEGWDSLSGKMQSESVMQLETLTWKGTSYKIEQPFRISQPVSKDATAYRQTCQCVENAQSKNPN